MDSFTRAATRAAVESSAESERDAAEACLRVSSKCLSQVSRCIGSGGPCKKTLLRPEARSRCRAIGEEAFRVARPFCEVQCVAQVRGVRGSTVAMEHLTLDAAAIKKSEHGPKFDSCMVDCQNKQAIESQMYKECIDSNMLDLVAHCTKENCLKSINECMLNKCGIGAAPPGEQVG